LLIEDVVGDVLNDGRCLFVVDQRTCPDDELLRVVLKLVEDVLLNSCKDSDIAEEIIPNILSFDEKYIRAEAELIGSTKHKGWAFQKEWRYKILFYPLSTSHDSIHKDHREAFKLFLEGYKPPFDYVDLKIGNQYFSDMEIITGPMMESETYDDFYNFVKVIAPFMKISKSIYTGTIRKRVFDIPNTP
jgi:hypothetical protein